MADQWDFRKGEIYHLFGLKQNANESEIRKEYKRLALLYHPDKNKNSNSVQMFLLITKAIGILTDPAQRSLYNQNLSIWKD